MGVVAVATLGHVEHGASGRSAWLREPYEVVGPFNLDELEASGRITFEACIVVSRQRWQEEQVELRRQAREKRREQQERQRRRYSHAHDGRGGWRSMRHGGDEGQHRETLNLPREGKLASAQIKAAFRRLARTAHPDTGGSHEQFIRITEARNALLELDA
jgi:hypothetical protein